MKWSELFIPTLKDAPADCEAISHKLLARGGFINMLTSGVYSYLPLGLRVLVRIQNIIREEMNSVGSVELLLPNLHPIDLWKTTGRDEVLDEVMFKFKDNHNKEMCLGPTHEEVITDIVKKFVQSYKQLPMILYQIQTKFRDELRTRFGIVRACEFIMKDAYSFDCDQEGLQKNYDLMHATYLRIFKRLNLDVIVTEADSGAMGGSISHEFMVLAEIGEDKVSVEENGKICEKVAIELGHIFQLGTKYTEDQNAKFINKEGQEQPIIMGCYGIGVSRVIAAIVEIHSDDKGIMWPREIAPFDIEIISLHKNAEDKEIIDLAERYLKDFKGFKYDVLVDDRLESPGRKFNDADLVGIPIQVIIGHKHLKSGKVEVKIRKDNRCTLVDKDNLVDFIRTM